MFEPNIKKENIWLMKRSKESDCVWFYKNQNVTKRFYKFQRKGLLPFLQKSDCDKPIRWISKPDFFEVTKFSEKNRRKSST